MRLTKEQWRDIERARARLRAWKAQFQTYPPYPEKASTLVAAPSKLWAKEQWQYVQQLRAQVNYLNEKVMEIRAEKKKSLGEY